MDQSRITVTTVCVCLPDVPELAAAVSRQTRAPDATACDAAPVAGLASALKSGATWLWLLDGSAIPRPGALEALLGAASASASASDDLPAPTVLASLVVDAEGRVLAGVSPWVRRSSTPLMMRSVAEGLLPIRATRCSSALVATSAARRIAPLRGLAGPGASIEWTARLLRAGTGYLVPASAAEARAARPWIDGAVGADPVDDQHVGGALLTGPAFSPMERIWVAAEVAGRARAAARQGHGVDVLRGLTSGMIPALRSRRGGRARPAGPGRP